MLQPHVDDKTPKGRREKFTYKMLRFMKHFSFFCVLSNEGNDKLLAAVKLLYADDT